MAQRGSFYKFFKSIDRYGRPISLTYNGQKSHSTFWGGFATLLTVIVCISWWINMGVDALINPEHNFTVNKQSYLTESPNTGLPTYNINMN